ncbi:hypothetical protein WJX72_000864 [[Myrmecia] bisecta]|uniref:Hflx-type G domain-containing protein n=1 Tax=[Myrmecia] bisecta TaxID=41462 RepID=A0AAW1R4M0_9CHLO
MNSFRPALAGTIRLTRLAQAYSCPIVPPALHSQICVASASLAARLGLAHVHQPYSTAAAAPLFVVHPRRFPDPVLQEALRLAQSLAGSDCQHVTVGTLQAKRITPATYFGPGVVKQLQQQFEEAPPAKVFVNAVLSGVQQRNLEVAWGVPVVDRVGLIIDIFGQRANTREARLQVELASLEYKASRLVRVADPNSGGRKGFGEAGSTEVVSARERGRSGSASGGLGGGGGGGESELQLQRRRIASRRKALQRKLQEVRRTREVQRAGRRRAGKAVVAVVGYTNAGKSSLITALSGSDVGVEDKLFATLDPMLRRVMLPSGRQVIFSDTVGFISDLPPQLVDAFQATLEEVVEADLLLHVLDASAPDVQKQRAAVLQVLRSLGISQARLQNRLIEVWNKMDLLPAQPSTTIVDSTPVDAPAHDRPEDYVTSHDVLVHHAAAEKERINVLLLVDKKVSVQCATRELAEKALRVGPRLLQQNLVGPPVKSHKRHHRSGMTGMWEDQRAISQWLQQRAFTALEA